MISSVPSRRCEIASERIASSVTTPPALRITWASPSSSPSSAAGSRRASMHATTATCLAGRQRQVALVELGGVGVVVGEQLVGDAHDGLRWWGSVGAKSSTSGSAYQTRARRPVSEDVRASATNAVAAGDSGPTAVDQEHGAAEPRCSATTVRRPVVRPAPPAVAGRASPHAGEHQRQDASRCAVTTAIVGVTPASANASSSWVRVAVPGGAATNGNAPRVRDRHGVRGVASRGQDGEQVLGAEPHGHEVHLTARGVGRHTDAARPAMATTRRGSRCRVDRPARWSRPGVRPGTRRRAAPADRWRAWAGPRGRGARRRRRRPLRPPPVRCRRSASSCRAGPTSASPAAVRTSVRPVRWKSAVPSSASSSRTACDTEGCETCSASAARVIPPFVHHRQEESEPSEIHRYILWKPAEPRLGHITGRSGHWTGGVGAHRRDRRAGRLPGGFGKGGSAIGTPMLDVAGVAPIAAVASPLPGTIPGTLVAGMRVLASGSGRLGHRALVGPVRCPGDGRRCVRHALGSAVRRSWSPPS